MKYIRLILMARYPVVGQAKTRLIPAVGAKGAAQIHKILAQNTALTLSTVSKQQEDVHFILSYTGGELKDFEHWFCDDAGVIDIEFSLQPDGDLSDRLLSMLHPAPVIFFGSDTPDLSTEHVKKALQALHHHDVVIGPALDGGYYCIGMNVAHEMLLTDMPWSTDQVLPITLERCKKAGLSVHMLEALSDCDMPEDLTRWGWLHKGYPEVVL